MNQINGHHIFTPKVSYFMQWVEELKKTDIHSRAELYMPWTDSHGFPALRAVIYLKQTQENPPRYLTQEYLIGVSVPPEDEKYGLNYILNIIREDIAHAGK